MRRGVGSNVGSLSRGRGRRRGVARRLRDRREESGGGLEVGRLMLGVLVEGHDAKVVRRRQLDDVAHAHLGVVLCGRGVGARSCGGG
eukprot:2288555-Prymnesium_polylepis.1